MRELDLKRKLRSIAGDLRVCADRVELEDRLLYGTTAFLFGDNTLRRKLLDGFFEGNFPIDMDTAFRYRWPVEVDTYFFNKLDATSPKPEELGKYIPHEFLISQIKKRWGNNWYTNCHDCYTVLPNSVIKLNLGNCTSVPQDSYDLEVYVEEGMDEFRVMGLVSRGLSFGEKNTGGYRVSVSRETMTSRGRCQVHRCANELNQVAGIEDFTEFREGHDCSYRTEAHYPINVLDDLKKITDKVSDPEFVYPKGVVGSKG